MILWRPLYQRGGLIAFSFASAPPVVEDDIFRSPHGAVARSALSDLGGGDEGWAVAVVADAPLVERESRAEALGEAVAGAREGAGRRVLPAGGAGVGKPALVKRGSTGSTSRNDQ